MQYLLRSLLALSHTNSDTFLRGFLGRSFLSGDLCCKRLCCLREFITFRINYCCSGSQKHKAEATSSSSIEQEKESGEKQDASGTGGVQGSNNQENIPRTTTGATGSGGQENTASSKDNIGRTAPAQSNLAGSPRPEIPRWVLDEIEVSPEGQKVKQMQSLLQCTHTLKAGNFTGQNFF